MKNNQTLTISDNVTSKITDKTRAVNLINFFQKLEGSTDLISDAPTCKLDNFINRNDYMYNHFIEDFNRYCPDDNAISNTIALNKMNATCLYFNLLNMVLGENEGGMSRHFLRAIDNYFRKFNIRGKRLDPSWSQNQFSATFDNFDHIIADIYLLYDLLRFLGLDLRGAFELGINKKINFESLYNNCDHKWLLDFTINKSDELSKQDVQRIILDLDYITNWVHKLSQGSNSKESSFFLAWAYFNFKNNPDRQVIVFNAIKNNISTVKNKEKNKSVSISLQDYEKLTLIANKRAGGKAKIALSMIINDDYSRNFSS